MTRSAPAPAALRGKAERLRALHHGDRPLVLVNAWDGVSARLVEEAGFPAVATTSAGIAFAHGLPDGERITRKAMLDVVRRIAAAVSVPVTADLEAGYGAGPAAVARTVRDLVAAGAVGLNLEDARGASRALLPVATQEARLRAAREAAASLGVPVVINARTDALHGAVATAALIDEAVRRGNAYLGAGADCVFVPFVRDAAAVVALARGIGGPLNILAGPGLPGVAELWAMGVRRISLGSGAARAVAGLTRRIAAELRDGGSYGLLAEWALPYDELQRLLAARGPAAG